MPVENSLRIGVVGGLGLMASPMAKHWHGQKLVKVLRVHDRGNPGTHKDQTRQDWKTYGASLVKTFADLIGDDKLDGVFVCAGKNGDDLPIIAELGNILSKKSPGSFICHMSTVSPVFVIAAHEYCKKKKIDYVNYPLTGGPTGAKNATMLILASGDMALYQKLLPALSLIGKPQHFGDSTVAGAQVKLIGQFMVFNGLLGITSAAAAHTECLNNGQLGGEKQSAFFDFLNGGAGSTKQWDAVLRNGINDDIWDKGFFIRHAVVDAIYAAQLLIDKGVSLLAIQSVINIAMAFSYILNNVDQNLATHAIVKEMIAKNAPALDKFLIQHHGPSGDAKTSLAMCIGSLPENIRKTVALDLNTSDFENATVLKVQI